ncbi:Type 1 glutamine amidotransferase-like domain-containing protein [Patescibacteria group bacterium]|nr:Type 1 glutamine amidotransferase-like domain-containing protein [Patescibacteria group bacterium]
MKTLLLTSAGMEVKEEILNILPKPANQIKLAHIITASKVEKDTSYVDKDINLMKDVGFSVINVDLEGKNEVELRKLLEPSDIIYVQGGNTFYLLKWVKESGFDTIAKEFVEKEKIYIGVSAGSIIAGSDIEIAGWDGIDRNEVGLEDFSGLGFVPFCIFPHYKPEHSSFLKEEIAKYSYPVRILNDGQAFLVRGTEVTLIGENKEVRL